MKPGSVVYVLIAIFLTCASAHAQESQEEAVKQKLAQAQQLDRAKKLYFESVNTAMTAPGAWWTNKKLVARLGLTDDQKTKIERAFENHRFNLDAGQKLLEREETQLAHLLEADNIDRGAVLSQIDRVTQARSELERTNSVMSLEMREAMTRSQWTLLSQQGPKVIWYAPTGDGPTTIRVAPAERGGGGRGQRQ